MSDEGVFAVHRGIFSHPLFEGEPYSRRDAWTWLLAQAAWKPTRTRVCGKVIELERGQLSFSERFLAEKWKWHKSSVHRFLACLETEAMLNQKTNHGVNLLTICNYDAYQFTRTSERTDEEKRTEPAANQQRTKEEELNNINIHTEVDSARARVSRGTKKPRLIPLPDGWSPNLKHRELASRMSLNLSDQEDRFRDYLNSTGKQYANYDAAFSNFLRNAPRFSRSNGNGYGGQRALQNAGYGDSDKSVVAAAGRLRERLRAFDEPAPGELRGAESGDVVRLLPKG